MIPTAHYATVSYAAHMSMSGVVVRQPSREGHCGRYCRRHSARRAARPRDDQFGHARRGRRTVRPVLKEGAGMPACLCRRLLDRALAIELAFESAQALTSHGAGIHLAWGMIAGGFAVGAIVYYSRRCSWRRREPRSATPRASWSTRSTVSAAPPARSSTCSRVRSAAPPAGGGYRTAARPHPIVRSQGGPDRFPGGRPGRCALHRC